MRRRKQDSLPREIPFARWSREQHSAFLFPFFFSSSEEVCGATLSGNRRMSLASHFQIYEWLDYSGETARNGWRIQRGVFFLLRGGGRRKEIDVFRSLPATHFLPMSTTRERADCTIAAGFMREHQTSPGDQTGYRRLYTGRHWRRWEPASSRSGEWKTRSFASPPSWISPIHGLLPRRRLPEQRCFSRATTKRRRYFAASPSVSSTYLTRGYGSPSFRHRYLCTRNEFDRVPIPPLHVSRPDDSI